MDRQHLLSCLGLLNHGPPRCIKLTLICQGYSVMWYMIQEVARAFKLNSTWDTIRVVVWFPGLAHELLFFVEKIGFNVCRPVCHASNGKQRIYIYVYSFFSPVLGWWCFRRAIAMTISDSLRCEKSNYYRICIRSLPHYYMKIGEKDAYA